MTQQEKTKERILKVANELFASLGFAATTVRDIAQRAEVNLAAINYHFKNKENLYWAVFDWNYTFLDEHIETFGKEAGSTEELTRKIFQFFVQEKAALMNTFKIFLSDNVELPEGQIPCGDDDQFGPPGHKAFLQRIQLDLKNEVSEESAYWAMKMIFSLLVHFGVVLNTTIMQQKQEEDPSLSCEAIEEMLVQSTRAHLNHLKVALEKS